MPLEQISTLFSDLYGYELNSKTVERGLVEGDELAAPVEAEVRSQLQQASVVHFDETGIRLTEQQDAVLAFALVAGVPFTNNQAERDLRPAKVKRKVSAGFRTQQGARVYARLPALIATCRKQQRNVFLPLRQLFAHQPVSLLAGG